MIVYVAEGVAQWYTELLSEVVIAVLYREYSTAVDQSESRTNRFIIIFMYMCSVCSGMIYINTNYMLVHDLNAHLVFAFELHKYFVNVSYFVCFAGISQDLDLADAFDEEPSEYDIYNDDSSIGICNTVRNCFTLYKKSCYFYRKSFCWQNYSVKIQ